MKKEKQEIATNTSAGAEKVETIEKELAKDGEKKKVMSVKTTRTTQKTQNAKGDSALGDSVDAKEVNARAAGSAAEKESAAAKARVERALKKKEEQQKRKEARTEKAQAKAAAKAKRTAKRKALAVQREAERKERQEQRKAKQAAYARERAHKKANKNQQKSREKANRKSGDERNKGYGGWLAAVISLGAVTLALTTVVTVGAMDMRRIKSGILMSNKGTMYELTGIMEHVDDDLDRARISASPAQQSRILTDLLVQARLAELDLEKLPIDGETDKNITTFINRTAATSEKMLAKLRQGERLNDKDFETIESLYRTNHAIRQELDTLMEKMQDKDLKDYMKDAKGTIGDALGRLEELTMTENRAAFEGKKQEKDGAGMRREPEKEEKSSDENEPTRLEQARAEELCGTYFADYNIQEFQCVGETVNRSYAAYNVQGYDDKGTLLFAEIDQKSGELLRFDYYEDCKVENFDVDNAKRIAEEFLEKLGYEDMEAVRLRDSGTTTDFTFVYEDDDVVYYPDEIRIKVCRTRGVVTGMDATKYLQNHRGRVEPNVKINLGEAYEMLHEKLTVEASRLAVVKTARGEKAAYEFLCSYEDEKYFVYLSAETGEEISIINARAIG